MATVHVSNVEEACAEFERAEKNGHWTANPILRHIFRTTADDKNAWFITSIRRFRRKYDRRSSLWLQMSLVQPPAKEVRLFIMMRTSTAGLTEAKLERMSHGAERKGWEIAPYGPEVDALVIAKSIRVRSSGVWVTIEDLMWALLALDGVLPQASKREDFGFGIFKWPEQVQDDVAVAEP
ncbi:uncharacterized protein LTR77_006687 [Saxophila tyrrhenica]|uniref:Uncharacterized protein n=1 Tax=Saxophila tyrrhenica TaxID=1690608 RepID=A0AAV9P5H7_9PEZI|nr:hypothetical protein LTR77_006687 [Saxophila tyrrhenica]